MNIKIKSAMHRLERLSTMQLDSLTNKEQKMLHCLSTALVNAIKLDSNGKFFLETLSNMFDPTNKTWYIGDDNKKIAKILLAVATKNELVDELSLFHDWVMMMEATSFISMARNLLDLLERGGCLVLETHNTLVRAFREAIDRGAMKYLSPAPMELAALLGIQDDIVVPEKSVVIEFPYSQLKITVCAKANWRIEYKIKY